MSENGIYQGKYMMRFTEKAWHKKIREYFSHLGGEIFEFFTIAVMLGSFVYILLEALDSKEAPVGVFVMPVIIIALIVVLYRALIRWKTYTPDVLQNESNVAKNIFRKQKCGWQFALAKQMAADKMGEIDSVLKRSKSGAEFIEPAFLTTEEYLDWLRLRPVAIRRLVRAAMIQCTEEIPALLGDVDDNEAYLTELKVKISALIQLYECTKKYETECYQILPQEPFVEAHEMTHGWTEPIQKGINEFMQALQDLATLDRKQLRAGRIQPPVFNIIIKAPANVEEFCKRLDEIIIQKHDS